MSGRTTLYALIGLALTGALVSPLASAQVAKVLLAEDFTATW